MLKPKDFNEYVKQFPEETQAMLKELHETIKKAAPKAEEVISYGMPAFRLNRMLVYFGGYKHHIGFHPTATGIQEFKKELSVIKVQRVLFSFLLISHFHCS